MKEGIVFFDGVCNFCNGTINFVIDRDKKNRFKFAPLQSELAKETLPKYGVNPEDLDSIVLIQNGKAYQKSSAVLKIAKELSMPWSLIYGFYFIPAFIRNPIYVLIAKNRYKLFGKSESCRIPTPEMRAKFIQ